MLLKKHSFRTAYLFIFFNRRGTYICSEVNTFLKHLDDNGSFFVY